MSLKNIISDIIIVLQARDAIRLQAPKNVIGTKADVLSR